MNGDTERKLDIEKLAAIRSTYLYEGASTCTCMKATRPVKTEWSSLPDVLYLDQH